MDTALGSFEGHMIDVGALKLSGSATERVGTLALGEEAYVVAPIVVSKIEHGEAKEGFVRLHRAEAVSIALIGHDDGKRMLAEAQELADRRYGVTALFGRTVSEVFGDRATVDGNTITVTADENGEIAEATDDATDYERYGRDEF